MDIFLFVFLAVMLIQGLVGWVLYTRIERMRKETADSISTSSGELKTILDNLLRNMRELSDKLEKLENVERETLNTLKEEINKNHTELMSVLKRIEEPININEVLGYDKKR